MKDFVEEFISKCIDKGVSSPKDICKLAQDRMDSIDIILRGTDNLRVEKTNLKKVIKTLAPPEPKKRRRKTEPNSEPLVMGVSNKELLSDICEFIVKNGPSTPKQILEALNQLENNVEVYIAIKTLCENGILIKNEDKALIGGNNWINRPVRNITNVLS